MNLSPVVLEKKVEHHLAFQRGRFEPDVCQNLKFGTRTRIPLVLNTSHIWGGYWHRGLCTKSKKLRKARSKFCDFQVISQQWINFKLESWGWFKVKAWEVYLTSVIKFSHISYHILKDKTMTAVFSNFLNLYSHNSSHTAPRPFKLLISLNDSHFHLESRITTIRKQKLWARQ